MAIETPPCKDTVCSRVVPILLQLFPTKMELLHKRLLTQKCNLYISCHKYKEYEEYTFLIRQHSFKL